MLQEQGLKMKLLDKNLEIYLKRIGDELNLLRESLITVRDERGKTLSKILSTLSHAKEKEKQEAKVCPLCQQDVRKRARGYAAERGKVRTEATPDRTLARPERSG